MVIFEYNGKTIIVKNPEFGNTDTLEFTRVSRTSRGNDSIVYRDPEWPQVQKLSLSFSLTTEEDLAKMRAMIRESLGNYVSYTHTDGETYTALILNPDASLVESSGKTYKVAIDLEVNPPVMMFKLDNGEQLILDDDSPLEVE